LKPKLFYRI